MLHIKSDCSVFILDADTERLVLLSIYEEWTLVLIFSYILTIPLPLPVMIKNWNND